MGAAHLHRGRNQGGRIRFGVAIPQAALGSKTSRVTGCQSKSQEESTETSDVPEDRGPVCVSSPVSPANRAVVTPSIEKPKAQKPHAAHATFHNSACLPRAKQAFDIAGAYVALLDFAMSRSAHCRRRAAHKWAAACRRRLPTSLFRKPASDNATGSWAACATTLPAISEQHAPSRASATNALRACLGVPRLHRDRFSQGAAHVPCVLRAMLLASIVLRIRFDSSAMHARGLLRRCRFEALLRTWPRERPLPGYTQCP